MKWETHCLIFMSFFSILKNYNDVFWHFGVQCMFFYTSDSNQAHIGQEADHFWQIKAFLIEFTQSLRQHPN